MTPPPRSAALAVVLAAALVLGACAGDDDASTGTLELAPSTTVTTAPEDAALAERVLTEVPLEGFVPADAVVGTGPLDLEAAAASEADPEAERALLEEAGFQRGVSRTWVDTDQDVAYVAVYRFDDAAGATAYAAAAAERLRGLGATTFEVPEVDGATGFTTVEEVEAAGDGPAAFTTHAVTFVRDDEWALVLVASPTAGVTAEQARAVAAEQAARLG